MESAAPRVVDSENVAGIMHPIMLRHQLQPQDVQDDRRYQDVHGRGEFSCVDCYYRWNSYFSWIRIDLFDQRINYRWSMKCKTCEMLCKPTFSVQETEKLVEKAVCRYKGIPFRPGNGRRFVYFADPHSNFLCEKCGWGATQCWVFQHR